MRQGTWGTRLGIYLAAIGSAFGLGSLWRFPYVVAENGGGAFVFLYFLLVIVLGVPLLIGELLIGKVTRKSAVAAQKQLVAQALARSERRGFWLRAMPATAIISVISSIFILGYYSVISGWVLYYLVQFLAAPFSSVTDQTMEIALNRLQTSGGLQIILSTSHLLAVIVVVAKGVEDGIEKWVGFIIPIFVGILGVLISRSLFIESSPEAWRYFFYPDFSKLNISSLGAAIGQLCFTLSIGFGPMITFGSYLRDDSDVPSTGFRVATMDSLTALISGLLIFPLVAFGSEVQAGPELLFKTVPGFLLNFEGGKVFGIFFFICLYLAALGASISLVETVVANMNESLKWGRGRSSLVAGALCFLASLTPALSSSAFRGVSHNDRGILEITDRLAVNWVLPILALFYSFVVVYKVSEKWKREEFIRDEAASNRILFNHWRVLMKWVIPPVIILGLVLQVIDLFL